ncbi:hypothetical protein JX265_012982 [Neoarthrinium moseri]|uniref:Uncharacterized protein n=1 Tax=Neoarthrinium moseri TaxID=1658444 RepID=A0A9P9W976_9PEZI|nr:uncharacterized protein JN550_000854 [Neoarthrinium moseri]KAI1849940.1 hypothetical protein JX266_004319 [Neoarthrinium moseri]KAI1852523.1 hypothetical protein JX265_012982 [Neoarthrinium moseri]KAI1876782.1 hypothetical protein JN550_000854 [Neoarthrinium moseri]
MEAWQSILISLVIVCAVIAGSYTAYEKGLLDPIIEEIGVMMFKAKAKAEREKYQAQGMKAGEDFVDSQLKGNKQAVDVISGQGPIGGLKKQL